jgi:hypothetical protein
MLEVTVNELLVCLQEQINEFIQNVVIMLEYK